MRIRFFHGFVAAALLAAPAAAQQPVPLHSIIALNPLGIPFDIGSIEFETVAGGAVTVGGLASYTALDDNRWTTFEGKVRYYPAEIPLRGLSVGGTLGFSRYSRLTCCEGVNNTEVREKLNTATIGVIVDYNWLYGRSSRFVLGTGVGAKRFIASKEDRERVDLPRAYPTVRFVIGWAF